MRTKGASKVKNTPGWICAVRDRLPASGETPKESAQKLRRNAARLATWASGETMPS